MRTITTLPLHLSLFHVHDVILDHVIEELVHVGAARDHRVELCEVLAVPREGTVLWGLQMLLVPNQRHGEIIYCAYAL